MATSLKAQIDTAYARLARAVEHDTEGEKLLRLALQSARAGEKEHRRFMNFGPSTRGYRLSVETTARFFVVKWFAEPRGKVLSARDAAAMRPDCLYAMALRELVDSWGKTVDTGEVETIDYVGMIVSAA